MKRKTRLKIKTILNIVLISSLSISCWEVGKKQFQYIENQTNHKKIVEEKEKMVKEKGIQKYLYNKDYEWIEVSGTLINYPLVVAADNQYYLTHDYTDEVNIAGAIYYDAADEPYNNNLTIIYGHSMRDGTMFNNLHYFKKDVNRFRKSELIISSKYGVETFKPLGFAIYDANNPFYRKLDTASPEEITSVLGENCTFLNSDMEITDNTHIMALVTCEYSIDDGRLVVFYISQ